MSEIHFRDRGWEEGMEQEKVSGLAVGAAPVAFGPPLVHTAWLQKLCFLYWTLGYHFMSPQHSIMERSY